MQWQAETQVMVRTQLLAAALYNLRMLMYH